MNAVPALQVAKKAVNSRQHDVFIVDKDVHLRRLLTDFLADLDCAPRFFDEGYAALDEARRHPPSLLITEVLVPQLDGLALCRLIKGDATLSSVKVLVLSVLSAGERAFQARADAFMKKPIERASLVSAIRSLIRADAEENEP